MIDLHREAPTGVELLRKVHFATFACCGELGNCFFFTKHELVQRGQRMDLLLCPV